MNFLFMIIFGIAIALLFNIISKHKFRSLYFFSAIGSIVGSIAVDPAQFLIIPSLVGSAIFSLIVLYAVKI
tara:strand:+ start:1132 stop:1344 length:213 start_codon:yes stop_codon:yes gene_type:complete